jgi:hypothetical protein
MQRLTTRTGTGMWVPVPADPLTSPGPANAILPLSHNRSIRVYLPPSYLLTLLLPSLLHPSLVSVSSQKPITVGVKPMASLSGSPETTPSLYLANGLNKFLAITFFLVFPPISTPLYPTVCSSRLYSPYPTFQSSNLCRYSSRPPPHLRFDFCLFLSNEFGYNFFA